MGRDYRRLLYVYPPPPPFRRPSSQPTSPVARASCRVRKGDDDALRGAFAHDHGIGKATEKKSLDATGTCDTRDGDQGNDFGLQHIERGLKRALEIRVAVLGGQHPDVATTLEKLSAVYAKQNKGAEAKESADRAAAIRLAARK